ncbi:Uncharacterised protein [uncultured archaeon]|nr:Uncharacterised protein [uncultured archaeon]
MAQKQAVENQEAAGSWNSAYNALAAARQDIGNAKSLDEVRSGLRMALKGIGEDSRPGLILAGALKDLNLAKTPEEAKEIVLKKMQETAMGAGERGIALAARPAENAFMAAPALDQSLQLQIEKWMKARDELLDEYVEKGNRVGSSQYIASPSEAESDKYLARLAGQFLNVMADDPLNGDVAKILFQDAVADFQSKMKEDATGMYKEAADRFEAKFGLNLTQASALVGQFRASISNIGELDRMAPYLSSPAPTSGNPSAVTFQPLLEAIAGSAVVSGLQEARNMLADARQASQEPGLSEEQKAALASQSSERAAALLSSLKTDISSAEGNAIIYEAMQNVNDTSMGLDKKISQLDGLLNSRDKGAKEWQNGLEAALTPDQRAYIEKRGKLMNAAAEGDSPYSDYEVYKVVSNAYSAVDVIRDNERIMADANFMKLQNEFRNSYFKSDMLLAMKLRVQEDLFKHTKPEMESVNRWNRGGITVLEQIVPQLDSSFKRFQVGGSQTLILGGYESQYTDLNANTAGEFQSLFALGDKQTIVKALLADGTTKSWNGLVTVVPNTNGTRYSVGGLQINFFTGRCEEGSGQNATKFLVPGYAPQEGYPAAQSMSYVRPSASQPGEPAQNAPINTQQTLADLSGDDQKYLENFFRGAMKTLAHYSDPAYVVNTLIMPNFLLPINAAQKVFTQDNVLVAECISEQRRKIRRGNLELEKLLKPSKAKDAATGQIKTYAAPSNFRSDPEIINRYRNVTNAAGKLQPVQVNPYGAWIPSNIARLGGGVLNPNTFTPGLDADRVFNDQSVDVVQLRGGANVDIRKFKWDLSGQVISNVTGALPSFMPYRIPKIFLTRTDVSLLLASNLTLSPIRREVGGVEYSSTQEDRNSVYAETADFNMGRSSLLSFSARQAWESTNRKDANGNPVPTRPGDYEYHARAANLPGSLGFLPSSMPLGKDHMLSRGQLDVKTENQLVNEFFAFGSWATPSHANYELRIQRDRKNGTYAVGLGYRAPDGTFKAILNAENLARDDVGILFAGMEWNSGLVAPTVYAKGRAYLPKDNQGQAYLPKKAKDLIKAISDDSFAGMLIATNIGEDFGAAFMYDRIPGAPGVQQFSGAGSTGSLISDFTAPYAYNPATRGTSYEARKALSFFFSRSERVGMYASAIWSTEAGSKDRVDEIRYTYVADNSGSASVAASQSLVSKKGADIGEFYKGYDAFSVEGKKRFGELKIGGNAIWGVLPSDPFSLGTVQMPAYSKVAGGSMDLVTDSNRIFAQLGMLYNTEGRLWAYSSPGEGRGVAPSGKLQFAGRSESAKFLDILQVAEDQVSLGVDANGKKIVSGGAGFDLDVSKAWARERKQRLKSIAAELLPSADFLLNNVSSSSRADEPVFYGAIMSLTELERLMGSPPSVEGLAMKKYAGALDDLSKRLGELIADGETAKSAPGEKPGIDTREWYEELNRQVASVRKLMGDAEEAKKSRVEAVDVQAATDRMSNTYLGGMNVKRMSLMENGRATLSFGVLGGVTEGRGHERASMGGTGGRFSFDNITLAMQSSFADNPARWAGTFGLRVANGELLGVPFDKSITMVSGMTEKDAYKAFDFYQEFRRKQLGAYVVLEGETMKIYPTLSLSEAKKFATTGGLFYVSPAGRWRVAGEVKALRQESDGQEKKEKGVGVGVDFLRQPGDKPLKIPLVSKIPYVGAAIGTLPVSSMSVRYTYNLLDIKGADTGWGGSHNYTLQLDLHFTPF